MSYNRIEPLSRNVSFLGRDRDRWNFYFLFRNEQRLEVIGGKNPKIKT